MPKNFWSTHNLSHYRLAAFDQGLLVPVACMEVLMGDTFLMSSSALVRAATLVAPVMHPIEVRIHHWYVPNRVLWSDWDDFITGRNPALSQPQFGAITVAAGDMMDHMGVPPGAHGANTLVKFPVNAYNMIYNEFYRDQDLVTARSLDDRTLARIAWPKDYFTSARPSPQQGSAISIPFSAGTMAPVQGIGIRTGATTIANTTVKETPSGTQVYANSYGSEQGGVENLFVEADAANGNLQIFANLAGATGGGIDVNEFRMAMAMQRHLEARNRWGSRIQDYLAYHGIRTRDGRLDLPEYLGGGKQTIAFSEVLATAEAGSQKVGDQAGHGIAALRTRRFGRFFPEHGWVLSLMSVRPRTIYRDQLHRQWLRVKKDDHWQKEYEAFGPQGVLKKELYGLHGSGTEIFGFNGRHDEYRRHPSYVSGAFRTTTDNFWHLAREFSSAPTLNQSFIECVPPDRIYADTSEPELRVMVSHSIRARRLVSKRARY